MNITSASSLCRALQKTSSDSGQSWAYLRRRLTQRLSNIIATLPNSWAFIREIWSDSRRERTNLLMRRKAERSVWNRLKHLLRAYGIAWGLRSKIGRHLWPQIAVAV